MSEEQADQEDHDNHGKVNETSAAELTWCSTILQEGGEGGEEAILGEQRTKVTDILSPAAMTNAYYICHNVQVNYYDRTVILIHSTGLDVLQRIRLERSKQRKRQGEKEVIYYYTLK